MFHKSDEVIEFLEETMELHIPEELLKDKSECVEYIEDQFHVDIPTSCHKKRKLTKFLMKANEEFYQFLKQRKFLKFIKIFLFLFIFFFLISLFFYYIFKNSGYFILNQVSFYLFVIILVLLILIFFFIFWIYKIQKQYQIRWKKRDTIFYSVLIIPFLFFGILLTLLYGNHTKYRDYFIQEVMTTRNHQYLATLFYSNKTIENALANFNSVIVPGTESYEFEPILFDVNSYANRYEEQILTKQNPDDIYKMIKVEGTLRDGVSKYSGYLTVVYDPSKVKLATSVGAGVDDSSYGQILSQISKNNNALVAMNAGGFYDPNWNSNGGIPHGMVIKDGKLLTDFRRGIDSGGMIGFDQDDRLILKRVSSSEALNMHIRDAVDWGPYLIVNGINYFKEERIKWACARTAIGQRKDGIVLLLVVDWGREDTKGASYSDLADIMERYGAINAANLDGGTSTAMTEHHEYINVPFNGHRRTIRSLPNAWIVVE